MTAQDRGLRESLLLTSLQASVPLLIADLAYATPAGRVALGRRCADVIAAHGDDLQYGGKHCRDTHRALAQGLAVGAYQPGGIRFAGTLWCATHRPFGAAAEWPCADCVDAEQDEPTVPAVVTVDVAGGRL